MPIAPALTATVINSFIPNLGANEFTEMRKLLDDLVKGGKGSHLSWKKMTDLQGWKSHYSQIDMEHAQLCYVAKKTAKDFENCDAYFLYTMGLIFYRQDLYKNEKPANFIVILQTLLKQKNANAQAAYLKLCGLYSHLIDQEQVLQIASFAKTLASPAACFCMATLLDNPKFHSWLDRFSIMIKGFNQYKLMMRAVDQEYMLAFSSAAQLMKKQKPHYNLIKLAKELNHFSANAIIGDLYGDEVIELYQKQLNAQSRNQPIKNNEFKFNFTDMALRKIQACVDALDICYVDSLAKNVVNYITITGSVYYFSEKFPNAVPKLIKVLQYHILIESDIQFRALSLYYLEKLLPKDQKYNVYDVLRVYSYVAADSKPGFLCQLIDYIGEEKALYVSCAVVTRLLELGSQLYKPQVVGAAFEFLMVLGIEIINHHCRIKSAEPCMLFLELSDIYIFCIDVITHPRKKIDLFNQAIQHMPTLKSLSAEKVNTAVLVKFFIRIRSAFGYFNNIKMQEYALKNFDEDIGYPFTREEQLQYEQLIDLFYQKASALNPSNNLSVANNLASFHKKSNPNKNEQPPKREDSPVNAFKC